MNKKVYIHPIIKRPLILFVVMVALSIIITVVSESYLKHAYDGRESEKRAMRIWKNKIDGSRESNKIIDEYENRYLELVKKNVVGDENRLNWIETLQTIANARNMPSVKYNVSSQKLLEDKAGQHQAQGLRVYRSAMTLDIQMAHEGDLFAILNALEEKAQGLFVVDKCNIEASSVTANSKDNMNAYCELGWYTFNSAESEEK